jgi:hypothetical protein
MPIIKRSVEKSLAHNRRANDLNAIINQAALGEFKVKARFEGRTEVYVIARDKYGRIKGNYLVAVEDGKIVMSEKLNAAWFHAQKFGLNTSFTVFPVPAKPEEE